MGFWHYIVERHFFILSLHLIKLIYNLAYHLDQVKLLGRQPLKNFTWSTLEYFVPNGFWFWCNQVNSVYLCSEEVIKGIKHISLFEILFFKLFQLFTNPCENCESPEGPCILRIIYENSLYSSSHLQKKSIKTVKKRI